MHTSYVEYSNRKLGMNKFLLTLLFGLAVAHQAIAGFDEILNGGFPETRLYLLHGDPGTGKTTLAFQFLLEGIKQNQKGLYISFSESREELNSVAESHGWDINKLHMLEIGSIEDQLKPESQNTIFYPSEVEMNQTMDVLYSQIKKIKPQR